MRWIGRVWGDWRGTRRRELVDRASDASLGLVWRQVSARAPSMRPSVARGYIRARAVGVVSRAVANAMLLPRYDSVGGRSRIEQAVLDQVVDRLMQRVAAHRPSQLERRAA